MRHRGHPRRDRRARAAGRPSARKGTIEWIARGAEGSGLRVGSAPELRHGGHSQRNETGGTEAQRQAVVARGHRAGRYSPRIRMSSLSTIEATTLRPATVRLAHVCSNAAATARCSAADSGAPPGPPPRAPVGAGARGRQVADRSPHGRSNRAHRSARFAAPRCPNGVHSRAAGKIPQQKPSGGGRFEPAQRRGRLSGQVRGNSCGATVSRLLRLTWRRPKRAPNGPSGPCRSRNGSGSQPLTNACTGSLSRAVRWA